MSVPKYKRKGSQLDCFDRAQQLRVDALRDLRSALDDAQPDVSAASRQVIQRTAERLNDDLHALVCHILHANAINPQYDWEVDERRKIQDMAAGDKEA